MNPRAVIYARVSTDEQAKGYSLSTQIEACQAHANTRGYALLETFADDYTGASMDRPELNRLRDYMAGNPVDAVIVYDLDRLARKSAYQVLLEEEFKRAGACIEFVMVQYDDTDEGRLQKQIRGVIAEYEKAKILERSKRGKRGKAKSGFVVTGARPPYGYRVRSEPHKAWLEIDESEARIVRMIYDFYVTGDEAGVPMSANAIARRLTGMDIPTRGDRQKHVAKKHGKGVWQRAMVIHILTNETYTGTWHFGKTKMVEDDNHRMAKPKRGLGKQVARAREDWIPVSVPAIIDLETFAAAQECKVRNRRLLSGNTQNEYLMKGRLTCARCGYSMSGHTVRKKYIYYRCKGKDQVVSLCDLPQVNGGLVDGLVWEWAKTIIRSPESLQDGLQQAQDQLEQANHPLIARLEIIEEQIIDHQKQMDRLLDLYFSGDFPKDVLIERKTRLEHVLSNLRKEQSDLNGHIRKVTMTDEQRTFIQTFCAKISQSLENADFNAKRQIVELLDIHGKVACENGEKVVYLRCLVDPKELQAVSRVPISPSSNTGATATTPCACPPTVPSP